MQMIHLNSKRPQRFQNLTFRRPSSGLIVSTRKLSWQERTPLAAKNGFELGKVQEQVEKEFRSVTGETIKWQAQVKMVETKQVQMVVDYFAGKQSIRVDYVDLKVSDFSTVKPGDWVWITGKIIETTIYSKQGKRTACNSCASK